MSLPEVIFSEAKLKPKHQTLQLRKFFLDIPSARNKRRTVGSNALKGHTLAGEGHVAILGQRAPEFTSNFPIMLDHTSPTVSSALWL